MLTTEPQLTGLQTASNLQKASGYLEAFHHLCIVKAWEEASKILLVQLNTPTKEELHNQLYTWGYYHQQIELYRNLLEKLSYKWDYICLRSMADAYEALGEHLQATHYRKQHLETARNHHDLREEAIASLNLGVDYLFSRDLVLEAFDIIQPDTTRLKSMKQRTHYRAVLNWLTKYKPSSNHLNQNLPNLEIFKDLGETFHHLCEMEQWETASKVLLIRFNTPTNDLFHNQLHIWGYYQELIGLYRALVGKLNPKWDVICLTGIGSASNSIGSYRDAMIYLGDSLSVAKEIGERRQQELVLREMGTSCRSLGENSTALNYYQQSLNVAKDIGDRVGEGIAIGELGITYNSLGHYSKA